MAYWIFVGTYGTPAYVVKCDSMPVVRPHGFDDGDWRKFVSEESMKQLEERNEKLEKLLLASKALNIVFCNGLSTSRAFDDWRVAIADLEQP